MIDYVKECREQADNTFYDPLKESWTMVGDHIEKLEAALAHIYAWYPISVSEPIQTIHEIRDYARKALEGKDD